MTEIFVFLSSNMPDYLGKDQRKVKKDDDKDEKPFQGINFAKMNCF